MMKKVPRRVKTVRSKIPRLASRASRARIAYIKPDPSKPHVVKVFISPTRLHMRATVRFIEGEDHGYRCMGQVWSWLKGPRERPFLKGGRVLARMYLNADDMRAKPADIVSHECTHAGMAWVRNRKANLSKMVGEEVLCYAVGRMTEQVNRIGYTMGVWK